MNNPVHAKCIECARYTKEYVTMRSNGGLNKVHGCGRGGCHIDNDFEAFVPKHGAFVEVGCATCARSNIVGAGTCTHYCYDAANRTYPNWLAKGTMGAPDAAATKAATKAALEGSAKTSTHYQVGTKQPIEIMQEIMTPEEFQGFCRGNVIKYSLRLGHKDAPVKEVAKIEQYAKWLRMSLEGKTIKPMED